MDLVCSHSVAFRPFPFTDQLPDVSVILSRGLFIAVNSILALPLGAATLSCLSPGPQSPYSL